MDPRVESPYPLSIVKPPEAQPSIALGLLFAALQRAIGIGALAWLAGKEDPSAADARAFAAAGVALAASAALVWGLARLGRRSLRELGWSFEQVVRDAMRGVSGGVLLILGIAALAEAGSRGAFQGTLATAASWSGEQRLLFLIIGCNAAFSEETIFRGWLQPALIARLGRWTGLALGAALFALLHLNFQPVSLAAKLFFGLVLGALALRTRSLVAPAVAHCLAWIALGFA